MGRARHRGNVEQEATCTLAPTQRSGRPQGDSCIGLPSSVAGVPVPAAAGRAKPSAERARCGPRAGPGSMPAPSRSPAAPASLPALRSVRASLRYAPGSAFAQPAPGRPSARFEAYSPGRGKAARCAGQRAPAEPFLPAGQRRHRAAGAASSRRASCPPWASPFSFSPASPRSVTAAACFKAEPVAARATRRASSSGREQARAAKLTAGSRPPWAAPFSFSPASRAKRNRCRVLQGRARCGPGNSCASSSGREQARAAKSPPGTEPVPRGVEGRVHAEQ